MTQKITLKNVRINQVHVWEAQEYMGKVAYKCQYLLPKGSDLLKQVQVAMLADCEEVWPKKGKARLASFTGKTETCLRDGDLIEWEPLHGHMVLTANRDVDKGAPKIFNRNRDENGHLEQLKPSEGKIYSGVIANSTVEIWAQENPKYPGIRCTLINLQFVKHAPAFGGGEPASDTGLDDLGYDDDDDDLS